MKYNKLLAIIVTYFLSTDIYAIAGIGYSNPKVDSVKLDNMVAIIGNNNCSGIIVGARWVLTNANCSLTGNEKIMIRTGWKDSEGSLEPTHYIALEKDAVKHPAYQSKRDNNQNVLLKLQQVPKVNHFNAVDPYKVHTVMWKKFCLHSGLYAYLPENACKKVVGESNYWYSNRGETLTLYGFGNDNTLRTTLIEATHKFYNDILVKKNQSLLIGGYISGHANHHLYGSRTEEGDAGAPYLNGQRRIAAVHRAVSSEFYNVMTEANPISHMPEWLLATVNGWHYPTVVHTIKNKAIVSFQSLHKDEIDLLGTLSVDGLDIDINSVYCESPKGEKSSLLVKPFDICYMTIENTSNAESYLYLSRNEIITVDYGRLAW